MNTPNQPSCSLWNTEAPLILWVNDGFDAKRHLMLRNLNEHELHRSFATSDYSEAVKRQNLIRLCVENDAMRSFLLRDAFCYSKGVGNIPTEGQKFVDYFNPQNRNAFWERVDEFVDLTQNIPGLAANNPELGDVIEHLITEMTRLEKPEAEMGRHVVDQLLKSTTLDCTINLELANNPDGQWAFSTVGKEGVGHRLYALNRPDEKERIPQWIHNFFGGSWIGNWLYRWEKDMIQERRLAWSRPITVEGCPGEILRDVCQFMNDLLRQNKPDSDLPFPLPQNKNETVGIVVRVSYTGAGLLIRLVGLSENQNVPRQFEEKWAESSDLNWRNYYSNQLQNKLDDMKSSLRRNSYLSHLITNYYPSLKKWMEEKLGTGITGRGFKINSPISDESFKWHHAETICKADHALTYESSVAIRRFATKHMCTMRQIAIIAKSYLEKSKSWGIPISFPELVDSDEAVLSFDALWPVDLLHRTTSGSKGKEICPKDLKPITALGNLAAGISLVTGGNGAGKSTAGEEILGLLHDAASGFPVFGRNVKLNPRTVVGSIYLERGDGSTMQLSMTKTVNVLKEIEKHPMNGTFVFWDEAGTGTSASQGEILGMAILEKLRRIGCTVLVNTQIPSLAEKAQNRLGAKCFQVDMGHRITSGIGEPDILELAREMGISKELNLQ